MVFDLWDTTTRRKASKADKSLLYKAQGGKCMYCGHKLSIEYMHLDHKTPLARGGPDRTSNYQLLCGPCNNRKGDMTDGEFRRKYKLTPAREADGPPTRAIPQSYFEEITKQVAARKAKRRRKNEDLWW